MTKEEIEQGQEILTNLKALQDLKHVLNIPHPVISDGYTDGVCLIALGDEAEKEIKEAIRKAIHVQVKRLEDELEML